MSARERWRRLRAFARASFRFALAFRHERGAPVHCPKCAAAGVAIPARCPHVGDVATLDQRQSHAYDRLPADVRAQVARP